MRVSSNNHSGIIYCAENILNGKVYIGKTTTSLNKRRHHHYSDAKRFNKTYFHKALSKYDRGYWNWDIIASYEHSNKYILNTILNKAEIFYIQSYDSFSTGYNLTLGGEGSVGAVCSKEKRKQISDRLTGRKLTEQHCKNIGKSSIGRGKGIPVSEEQKKRISATLMGRYKGRIMSEETKNKISIANKGNTHWKGKKHTEETKDKMRIAKIGKKHSEKTKQKLSDSHKGQPGYWEGKKLYLSTRKKLSNSHKKKIKCIETGIKYNSVREAGGSRCSLVANGKARTALGYTWEWV